VRPVSAVAPSTRVRGIALLLIPAFAWGLNWPVLKFMMGEWQPFTFRVLSGAIGAVVLALLAVMRGEALWPPASQWGQLVLASVLNITSWMGLATLSLLWLDASEAAILGYTMPIWAAILAWPVLGERPNAWRIGGLAVGLCGVAVLMAGPLMQARAAPLLGKLPGVLCILGTAFLFALGAVVTKRRPILMPPVANVAWQVAIGMAPMLVAALVFDTGDISRVTPLGWAGIGYSGLVSLGVAYVAWFRVLEFLPASSAAIGTLLVPVIGVFSSALVLGEPLGLRQLGALALTLAGVALASRG
jgi:probable blue pigment (indigoidine) exporter